MENGVNSRNAVSDEFHEKLQMTVEVDARASNIMDPPLVAATRLDESTYIIEAIAVAASESQEESGLEVHQEALDSTATAATHAPHDAAADEGNHQRLEEQTQPANFRTGEAGGSTRKRSHLKIGMLVLLFLLIGAAVGVGIGVGGSSKKRNSEAPNGDVDPPIITIADIVSAFPSIGRSPSPFIEPMVSHSPTRAPRSCLDSFNLTLVRDLEDLRTADSPLPFLRRHQWRSTLPSAGQYDISRDGTTLVVDEYGPFLAVYDLTDESAEPPERTGELASVNAIALSDDGLWLAVGSGKRDIGTSNFVEFAPGGSLVLYQRDATSGWEQVNEIEIGGGKVGGVFEVGITEDGSTISFLGRLGGDESIMFVQVYSNSADAVLLPLGNALFEDWINYNTITAIVDDRLFVCSTDDFIRTYDLVEGAWQQIGKPIPHVESSMFIATGDNTRLITASLLTGIDVFELRNSKWQPLDLTALNEQVSSTDLVNVAVSSDGNEILVTETMETNGDVIVLGPTIIGRYFERVGNEFHLAGTLQFGRPAEVQATQITDEGNVVFVLDTTVLYYDRIMCSA